MESAYQFRTGAMPDLALTHLDDLTVLDLRGVDVLKFLNGQVSHDVTKLPQRGSQLAGLHNPQGRVIAVLRLFHLADDHVLAVLPSDLAETVSALLTRYVLRAKVKISEAGSIWKVYGITGPDAYAAASTRLHMPMGDGARHMIVAPRAEPLPESDPAGRDVWRLDDIVAGIPEITSATTELFVAQMLNLDLLDAISFDKGCYTGQEIIARAHFRGQVKRRMQRFSTGPDRPPGAAARVTLDDGRGAQIVMAAPTPFGMWEFLAIATEAAAATSAPQDAVVADAAIPHIAPTIPLPLPYA